MYTLNDGATWVKIATIPDGSNPGTYDWKVPNVTQSKTKCKVKVVLKNPNGDTIGSDVSNSYFTINPPRIGSDGFQERGLVDKPAPFFVFVICTFQAVIVAFWCTIVAKSGRCTN